MTRLGGEALALPTDVSDDRQVEFAAARTEEAFGPIHQPEVIARAIVWLSQHPRRELSVGFSTVKAVIGNKIAPWYADRYLARHGYASQQLDEPDDPDRPHNLWAPVPGDHGAHGPFDHRSRRVSLQFWLNRHRKLIVLGGAGLLAFLAGRALRGKNGRHRGRPLPDAVSPCAVVQKESGPLRFRRPMTASGGR